MSNISKTIVSLGFNCVRLLFSVSLWATNPPVPNAAVAANPHLYNRTAIELMDDTVMELIRVGLVIVLNNHNSVAGWCCDLNNEDGIWSTDR